MASDLRDQVTKYAFVPEKFEGLPCITLISRHLLVAFDNCVSTYIGVHRRRTSVIVVEPYIPLYRNLDRIAERIKSIGNASGIADIEALIWFLKKIKGTYDGTRYMLGKRKEVGLYSLWALFEAGEDVGVKDDFGEWRI